MILNSFFSALKMYSRIPCPQPQWKEENRRFSLCFFPAVGLVIAALFLLWQQICAALRIGGLLQGAVMMLIPLAMTGGFHMDGFCDVQDALSSCAPLEKKLEILKDPHIGAFAVIYAAAYLILQAALYGSITNLHTAGVIACGFVLSRALSGLCAVFFRAAKREGSLQDFVVPADRRATITALSVTAGCTAALMLVISPLSGALSIGASVLCLVHYRTVCYRQFGGITGDCAGYFLQNCELAVAAAALAAQILRGM